MTQGPPAAKVPAAKVPAAKVTVIIPARDEEESIEPCLDSVLTQRGPELQVIVIDNGSTDRTRAVVRRVQDRDPRVELVSQPMPSIPRTLNAGLAAAQGRWVVRVDAHSVIGADYIARAVEHLRTGRWVGVGGRKNAVATTPVGRAVGAVLGSRLAVGGSVYHWGTVPRTVDHLPFGVYPTALVRELGGWSEDIANNEDFELDQRLRTRGELLFDPHLVIEWKCRETIAGLFRQYHRYGTGKSAVALAHPRSVRLRHVAPPVLVVWLAASAVVSLLRPGVAAAAVLPYALAVTGVSVAINRNLPTGASRAGVPAALVAMQTGWGIGFWSGLLQRFGRKSQ